MKKSMMILIMAMSLSVSAQTTRFDRISWQLQLTTEQIQPSKQAFRQLEAAMKTLERTEPTLKPVATRRIMEAHKKTMKEILNEKQFEQYVKMLDLTLQNAIANTEHDETHTVSR